MEITKIVLMYTRSESSERSFTNISEFPLRPERGKNIKQARCVRDQKIDYDLPYRAHSFFFTIQSQYSKTCQSKENPFWLKKIFLLAP